MRRSYVALLVTAAGCGRIDFDSTVLTCPVSRTAPPTVTITGSTFHYTAFDNRWTPVPNTTVKATTSINGTVLDQVTSDGTGAYSLTITTGGQPIPVVLAFSAGGSYLDSYEHLDLPVDRDVAAPPMTMNDVFSVGDAPVWDTNAMQLIYDQVLLTRNPLAGTLNMAVRDCAGAPVDGVTVELDPPSELLRYQAPDGTASATLTSTGPPFDHALAFNSPPGLTRIIARKGGVVVADQYVEVTAGMFYTLTFVRAPGA